MADDKAVLKEIEIVMENMELNKEKIYFLSSSLSYSYKLISSTYMKKWSRLHGSLPCTVY